MSRKQPPKRGKGTPASGMNVQRKLDPRKGPSRASGRGSKHGREITFDDIKFPLIFICVASALAVAYYMSKPYFRKRESEVAFNACLGKVNQLRTGLEKHRAEHKTGYGVMDLYTSMGTTDNAQVEQDISRWCMGNPPQNGADPASQDTWWEFIDNLHISADASSYVVTAYAKTNPPCLIQADPNRIWPPDASQCGQPSPAKFAW